MDEKIDWVLRIWDYEKDREDAIRSKGRRILGLHVLILSSLAGGAPFFSALPPIFERPVSGFILSLTAGFALAAGLFGVASGIRLLNVRMRHVLDPTLSLREGGSEQQWRTEVIAEVLDIYKKNTRHLSQASFQVRQSLTWLVAMVLSAGSGLLVSWIVSQFETPVLSLRLIALGVVVGVALAFVLAYILKRHPRPHTS